MALAKTRLLRHSGARAPPCTLDPTTPKHRLAHQGHKAGCGERGGSGAVIAAETIIEHVELLVDNQATVQNATKIIAKCTISGITQNRDLWKRFLTAIADEHHDFMVVAKCASQGKDANQCRSLVGARGRTRGQSQPQLRCNPHLNWLKVTKSDLRSHPYTRQCA